MDDFVKRERARLIAGGAKSVFVLPYPYRSGHFCSYFEGGGTVYSSMPDEALITALNEWLALLPDIGEIESQDISLMRLRTYARLLESRSAGEAESSGELSEREKLLVRLVMDRNLRGIRDIALDKIAGIYCDCLREGGKKSVLLAAVNRLLAE